MSKFELAQLLIDALTPISVIVIGYYLNKNLALEGQKWKENDKLVSKRVEIYSEMAKPINQIYCYVQDLGDYKSLEPSMIIENKRISDRLFHMYRPIWSRKTIEAYKIYIDSAFKVFNGTAGEDAIIRTISKNKEAAAKLGKGRWLQKWSKNITEDRDQDHHKKYVKLMNAFSNDLGFKVS